MTAINLARSRALSANDHLCARLKKQVFAPIQVNSADSSAAADYRSKHSAFHAARYSAYDCSRSRADSAAHLRIFRATA